MRNKIQNYVLDNDANVNVNNKVLHWFLKITYNIFLLPVLNDFAELQHGHPATLLGKKPASFLKIAISKLLKVALKLVRSPETRVWAASPLLEELFQLSLQDYGTGIPKYVQS